MNYLPASITSRIFPHHQAPPREAPAVGVGTDVEAPPASPRLVQPLLPQPLPRQPLRPSLGRQAVVGLGAAACSGGLTVSLLLPVLPVLIALNPVGAAVGTLSLALVTGLAGATLALDLLYRAYSLADGTIQVLQDPGTQVGAAVGATLALGATALAALPLSAALPLVVGLGLAGGLVGHALAIGSLRLRIVVSMLLVSMMATAAWDMARRQQDAALEATPAGAAAVGRPL